MAKFAEKVEGLKAAAFEKAQQLNTDKFKEAADAFGEKASQVKDAAMSAKEDIANKLTEQDRMLEEAITEYNDVFTLMNDKGFRLFVERCRASDTIINVEALINSIANHPKSFDTDIEEINTSRKQFIDNCTFADRELQNARTAAGSAGAGLAAGSAVAFMAPTAAMWIATTFGTASTGTAISLLSGAAATNAALAWLGGGALVAGGGGVAAGNALLALAGPVGWTIAGASLLSSILLFTKRKRKLNEQKHEEIEAVKKNTEIVREMDEKIRQLQTQTASMRTELSVAYLMGLKLFGKDYLDLKDEQKISLGTLVNNTKALSAMLGKTIEQQNESDA